ncbi:sensor histidine kinase [Sphingomonas sp. RS6]
MLRSAVLMLAGAAGALAWQAGFYASAFVAAFTALRAMGTAVAAARQPRVLAPAAQGPAPDRAYRERRLTALLDLSPAPIVTLDGEGRLHVVNRAARRLFGTAELVAAPPPDLLAAIATGQARAATVTIAGRSYALTTSDFVLGGSQSRLAALIDIDAELKAAEAATLRDLVQVLSHEIVNALTPIASLSRTAVAMLDDSAPALPAIRDAVATVARRAEGLQRFGESYRALARLPAPQLQTIRIDDLVADLARLFATRWPGHDLQVAAAGSAPLRADADQLSAALWALLQNAAEATGGGGVATLTVETGAGETRFRIADNGPGIAAADREAIFRPFFTTKSNGSGVGLALARQIFLAHAGDLRLIPSVRGACFEGWLP